MFESLYEVRPEDKAPFGKHWMFPERFSHGEWALVAEYPKTSGDGYDVRLYECRMPARFYKVEAIPTTNSIGKARPGFAISTGSGKGMLELAIRIAEVAADGMIDMKEVGDGQDRQQGD